MRIENEIRQQKEVAAGCKSTREWKYLLLGGNYG